MLPNLAERTAERNERADIGGRRFQALGLIPRVLILALVFAIELLVLSVWLDNAALLSRTGLLRLVGQAAPITVRAVVGFAAIFFTFAYLTRGAALRQISQDVETAPFRLGFGFAHALAMAAFGATSWALYGDHLGAFPSDAAAVLWLVFGLCGIAFGCLALIPLATWRAVVGSTGALWLYSLVAVIAASSMANYSRSYWAPLVDLTFAIVKALLHLFVTQVVSIPERAILGTPRFRVEIAPQCSGFEGAGLILAFGLVWLWLFRKECRFPQSLLLLPAGVVALFLLNAVRITALILIGNAGAPQIALGGFHSQAGWISFNLVALGLAVAARRMSFFSNGATALSNDTTAAFAGISEQPGARVSGEAADNAAAYYLMPFLSILFVGMLATAVSAGFEWLYPLRFVAVLGVLWIYRRHYAAMDWRFGWFGVGMGVLVFGLWMGCDVLFNTSSNTGGADVMPAALRAASPATRAAWIAVRALAAIVTVPVAEELAFRGFAMRRFISTDVDQLPASAFTWLGLVVSSVVFGLMHGSMWFAGILAGFCYAWALIRGSRIGEAVIAHATTNALLAAYVLVYQKWHLW